MGENMLYRMHLMDYGCEMSLKEDGSLATYHMVFVILENGTENIVGWNDQYVDWTDSSEAYYKDALAYGVLEKKEQ